MKPYFAKYLPVEGGSLIIKNIGGKEEKIIGKLFLCSRDIQIGDEITDLANNKWGKVVTILEDGRRIDEGGLYHNPNTVGLPDSFKVIGEISPQATWVKEGDEFDEDELQRSNVIDNYRIIKVKCSKCETFH